MSDLKNKRCLACEGGVSVLKLSEVTKHLLAMPQWQLTENDTQIYRRFTFKNFDATMNFVNAVAKLSEQENHHPDLHVGYDYCQVNYTTHAIGGLSDNDFICAIKVDVLAESMML